MIIAIDFDNTICVGRYPEIGEPVPGALTAIQTLHQCGHTLVLWTCREKQKLQNARLWLNDQGVGDCFESFNTQSSEKMSVYDIDCRKIAADLYIDDAMLFCPKVPYAGNEVVDWGRVLEEVERLSAK
jgi:hypothetical protein